jgi:hypothetical protein
MAQSGARGQMDIQDQKETFHGFLMASVWTSGLIAQSVMLLTLAFAIGLGWWAGFVAFVLIGIVVGSVFKLSGVYWATQVALWVLLAIGGLIVPALSGMMG